MDQLVKIENDENPTSSVPMLLHPNVSTPSPTSSTSSRSSVLQRSASATSKPMAGHGAAEQAPLRCPRCNSSDTKFCYYNNYSLSQPRHFCKTCRRYWTKGGALRNVPFGGGCRRARLMTTTPAAKPAVVSCKAVDSGPPFGLGVGVGMKTPWAASQQAPAAQLMALLQLNSACRGFQGHDGSNVRRFLGLDSMGDLPLGVPPPGAGNAAGAPASVMWQPSAPRQIPATPPAGVDSKIGVAPLGHHDMLPNLGLKLPPSSTSQASSYYNDQLHSVVSNAGGAHHEFDAAATVTSLLPAVSSVSAALSSASVRLDQDQDQYLPPLSLSAHEMHYCWASPAAMSKVWPDLPTPNGAFS